MDKYVILVIGITVGFIFGVMLVHILDRINSAHGTFSYVTIDDEPPTLGIKFISEVTDKTETIVLTRTR